MFNFDIQRFGSSTTVTNSTPVNGATQLTETGKAIEQINYDYLQNLSPTLKSLAAQGGAQVGQGGVPDYSSMYQTGLNQINNANAGLSGLVGAYSGLNNAYAQAGANNAYTTQQDNANIANLGANYGNAVSGVNSAINNQNANYASQLSGVNSGVNSLNSNYANQANNINNQYSAANNNYANSANAYQAGVNNVNNQYAGTMNSLANGNLSAGYQANMKQAVADAMSPYTQQFNGLANRGVINSTIGNEWATDASRAANDAANAAFANNMSVASNVANNSYNSALSGANTAAGLNANSYTNQLAGINNLASNASNAYGNQMTGYNALANNYGNANQAALSGYNTMSGNINSGYNNQLSGLQAIMGNNAQSYSNQMGNLSALSGNYGNLANLYNNQITAAANPYNYAAGYQQAATSNAKDLLSLATGSYQPVGSTFSDYLKAGTGQQSSSKSTDNSGIWGALGTGAGLAFCFPADTPISTPDGDKPIQDVQVGDIVSTLVGDKPVTKAIQSMQPLVTIETDRGNLKCTVTEVLLSVEGSLCVEDMMVGDILIHKDGGATVTGIKVGLEIVPVYEIVVPYFYANGFVVDGFDPMEV